MDFQELKYDLNEIRQIIPESLIRLVLKIGGNKQTIESRYKNLPLVHNQRDWLWRAFMKFLMPFQMKTNKAGKRKTPFAALYTTLLITVCSFIIWAELAKYPIYLIWTYIIIRALLPYMTALCKLLLNKSYYRSMY